MLSRSFCATLLLSAAFSAPAARAQTNEGNIEQGKALFRSNCAFCHGLTAQGGRGPNLISSSLLHSASDDQVKEIIKNGVPGTTMPAFEMAKDDLENLVAYLHQLAGSNANNAPVPGDPAAGRKIYESNGCAACHRIGDEGGIYGPDLTRVGAGRSTEYIRDSIVNPSADVPVEYEGVTAIMRDGKRLTGVRVNEDTFTLQMRLPNGQFANFNKSDLQDVSYASKSLMPPYKLSPDDLQNLLSYLNTLRGQLRTGADVNKAQGIH